MLRQTFGWGRPTWAPLLSPASNACNAVRGGPPLTPEASVLGELSLVSPCFAPWVHDAIGLKAGVVLG